LSPAIGRALSRVLVTVALAGAAARVNGSLTDRARRDVSIRYAD
jgi:hypothetical protein